jgi:hypothetical protein
MGHETTGNRIVASETAYQKELDSASLLLIMKQIASSSVESFHTRGSGRALREGRSRRRCICLLMVLIIS